MSTRFMFGNLYFQNKSIHNLNLYTRTYQHYSYVINYLFKLISYDGTFMLYKKKPNM